MSRLLHTQNIYHNLCCLCSVFQNPTRINNRRAGQLINSLSEELLCHRGDEQSLKMGGSGSKAKGVWPFAASGAGGDSASEGNEQSVAPLKTSRKATPFVFTRRR